MTLKEYLLENDDELINIVTSVNGWDGSLDYLYCEDMEWFDEAFWGITASELARRIFFGDFNPNHDYFTFNGDWNLVSYNKWDYIRLLRDNIDEIVEAAYSVPEKYRDYDLEEFEHD